MYLGHIIAPGLIAPLTPCLLPLQGMGDLDTGRIRELHKEQQETQKKSFTKWINQHLVSVCFLHGVFKEKRPRGWHGTNADFDHIWHML